MLLRTKENTFIARLPGEKESIFLKGTPLFEILEHERPQNQDKIVLAKVNYRVTSLRQKIETDCRIDWVFKESQEGFRSYQQTLSLVMLGEIKTLFPKAKVYIDHSLENGFYCVFKGESLLNARMVKKIKVQMEECIHRNETIESKVVTIKEGLALLEKQGEKPTWHLGYKDLTHAKYGKLSHGILAARADYYWKHGQVVRMESGVDAEQIRHLFQNKLVHDFLVPAKLVKHKNPHYPMLQSDGSPYLFKKGQHVRPAKFYFQAGLNQMMFY